MLAIIARTPSSTPGVIAIVPVAVAVPVLFRRVFCGVEHEGHAVVLPRGVEAVDLGQHVPLHHAGAHDEECAGGLPGDDGGVGHDAVGRAVEQDAVIAPAQLAEQPFQASREEQLGGVGGYGAHGDDVEPRAPGGPDGDVARRELLPGQVAGEPRPGRAHVAAQRGAAQVEVDGHDPFALDGQAGGEVGRDERFSAARVHRGDHDGVPRRGALRHELEVRAQHAEGLVDGVAPPLAHHQPARGGLLLPPGQPPAASAHEGDLPGEGHRHRLHVLLPAHPGVRALADEEHRGGQDEPQGEGRQEHVAAVGRRGGVRAAGRRDDARVVGGEGLRELVLLALLQQEEVELLLHLLLALDGEQVLGLRGVGGDARRGLLLAPLEAGDLRVE